MTTLSTYSLRHKYMQSNLQLALQNQLIADAVCKVDRTEKKTIENPYIVAGTATIQAVAGTYSVSARTVTDDALSVDDEVIQATHVFDFERKTAAFDLMADFLDQMIYEVAFKVDQFAINKMASQATGTYTTPAGGFTTPSNIPTIFANILSKTAGYRSAQFGRPFVIIESTDVVGLAQHQVATGYTYADRALNNGVIPNYMGVDIYIIRTGTFVTATLGTLSATNSGKRLAGVANAATFATLRDITYEEKSVTGKTGKEVVVVGYIGTKVWTPVAGLFTLITLA